MAVEVAVAAAGRADLGHADLAGVEVVVGPVGPVAAAVGHVGRPAVVAAVEPRQHSLQPEQHAMRQLPANDVNMEVDDVTGP